MDRDDDIRHHLSRREILRRGTLAAGGLAAAGPIAFAPTPTHASSPARGEAADTSTLVVAVPEVPTNLDREFSFEIQAFDVLQNTMEEIVEWKQVRRPDGSYTLDFNAPMEHRLAESWSYSPGHESLTLNLRKGGVSGYGNELAAQDFKGHYD